MVAGAWRTRPLIFHGPPVTTRAGERVGAVAPLTALPATLLQDFAQFAPPAVAARAARVVTRAAGANWMDVPFNVVISNVPGPQFPIYGIGARLVANYPVSAINDGVGLNMTVQSYDGSLDFGLVACRELMPDLWELMDALQDEARVLKEAAKQFAEGAAN